MSALGSNNRQNDYQEARFDGFPVLATEDDKICPTNEIANNIANILISNLKPTKVLAIAITHKIANDIANILANNLINEIANNTADLLANSIDSEISNNIASILTNLTMQLIFWLTI